MDRWDAVARARLRNPAGASSEASEIDAKIKNKQCTFRVAVRASCPARGGQLRMNSSTSLTQTPPHESLEQALEQLACAIAGAQGALLGGCFRDLEACVLEQQDL